MEIYMQDMILYFSSCLSCFIVITILFGFMDGRYHRAVEKRCIYIGIKTCFVFGIAAINMYNNALINFTTWMLFVGFSSFFLYHDDFTQPLKRMLECEILIFVIAICESLGVVIVDWILVYLRIQISTAVMQSCIETAFSKIVLIFIYYMAISRLMKKPDMPFTKQQYAFNAVVILYSFVDIIVIADNMVHRPDNYLSVLNLGCIVLAALYLLYFTKIINEKNYLQYEVKALEEQARMQYKYYIRQEKEYHKTLRVLHDVNKHIETIEQLYSNGYREDVTKYTEEIGGRLQSLIPVQYTGNPILDILLTDRTAMMSEKEIEFEIHVDNVSLNFLDAIDITTIFGNLLDNAIEACEKLRSNRKIIVEISGYHEMLSVRVKNTFHAVQWKNGLPVSEKGKNHGLGLFNVRHSVEKYDGNIDLREENDMFVVDIFLNS